MRAKTIFKRTAGFSKKLFLDQKLYSVLGFLIIASISVFFGYTIARNPAGGMGLTGLLTGIFVVGICMARPEAGLYINIGYSFYAYHFSRLLLHDSLPIGVGSDALVFATFLGTVINKRHELRVPPAPVFTCFLVLYAYDALEFFNPYAHSFQGWYTTFRKVLAEFMLLYIGYNLMTDKKKVKRFIKVLFVCCTICGIYGCIQQWHGLFAFEQEWVMSDDSRFGLMFVAGEFRKFSTMTDPTGYAVIMAGCAVFFLVIALSQKRKLYRNILFGGIVFMLLGMAYSGTRTANAMFVAGLVFFILLSFDKKSTRVFFLIGGAIFLVIMYGPFSNATINRFRTTFSGTKDESYKVRVVNKAFIQPYIQSHPIGGGMGTTGGNGRTYNPSHFLAGFPPDSGYMKFALELGWLGLAIILVLYFNILKNAIHKYFTAKDPEVKTILAATICLFFSFYVAQFAQDSMGQITDIVVYFPLVAITLRGNTLAEDKQELSGG
jgi:hypothetical protein